MPGRRGSGSVGGLGEFIRSQRRLADLSLRELARLTKVSNPYLSQVERGIYQPSAQVLKAIADALQVSAETLFTQAGFLEGEDDEPTDVEDAIKVDPRLNTEQKETLIQVYRNFVGDEGQVPRPAPKRSRSTPAGGKRKASAGTRI